MKSADGKGRTLFEMLTGRNKRDMTAQELQVHNPLQAKVGWSVSLSYEADLSGYNFFVESIWVWETKIGDTTFHHTDYNLKATAVGQDKPIRIKLRLIPDDDSSTRLGTRSRCFAPTWSSGGSLQRKTTSWTCWVMRRVCSRSSPIGMATLLKRTSNRLIGGSMMSATRTSAGSRSSRISTVTDLSRRTN